MVQAQPLVDWTAFRIVHRERDVVIGTAGRALFIRWHLNTTQRGAQALRRELRTLSQAFPDGIFHVAVVAENAPMPEPTARAELAAMLRDGAAGIIAGAVLFEGAGLRASIVRGVAAGLCMAARPVFPFRACTRNEALALLEEKATERGVLFDRHTFEPIMDSALAELRDSALGIAPAPSGRWAL